ncbi:MAG: hypothetical protein AMXMBFR4_23400 [Candidatus Hydrogenedentota bacterium]
MRKPLILIAAVAAALAGLFAVEGSRIPEFRYPDAVAYDTSRAERFQVITVQMRWSLDDYASPQAFRARVAGLIEKGLSKCDPSLPTLAVFPEDVGLPLTMTKSMAALLDETNWEEAATEAIVRNGPAVLWNRVRHGVGTMRAYALSQAPLAGKVYVETFSELARQHQIYIIAGSAPLPEFAVDHERGVIQFRPQSGEVYNVSYMFGPDGRPIGVQRKVHLIDLESEGGIDLSRGDLDDLGVVDTPFGVIGIAICFDGFHDDVLDRLESLGAEILVQPSANPGAWNKAQQESWLTGSWKAVQDRESFECAINPMMTGPLFDLPFEGQSSIAMRGVDGAPGYREVSVDQGFVTAAQGHDTEEVLVTVFVRTEDGLRALQSQSGAVQAASP